MLAKGSVAAALGELVRGLRAAPPCESGDDEGSREWRVLAELAAAGGCLLGGPVPTGEGGREHDVEFVPGVDRWRKLTKPPNAGYFVDLEDEREPMMLPGTPQRYLERLALSAEVLADDVLFLGIHVETLPVGRNLRIVTSQRHIEGNAPDRDTIEPNAPDHPRPAPHFSCSPAPAPSIRSMIPSKLRASGCCPSVASMARRHHAFASSTRSRSNKIFARVVINVG